MTTSKQPTLDSLDLTILEKMLIDGGMTFKRLAELADSDQRTISGRFERMMKLGIVKRITIEVDWSKIGLNVSAYMGTTTALGERDRDKLFEYVRREPRILEADATLGSHEYFLKVLDIDMMTLRKEVCAALEPLTYDLTTSVIASQFKQPDHAGLFRYLRKRNPAYARDR